MLGERETRNKEKRRKISNRDKPWWTWRCTAPAASAEGLVLEAHLAGGLQLSAPSGVGLAADVAGAGPARPTCKD